MKNIAYITSLLLALVFGGMVTLANAQTTPPSTLGGSTLSANSGNYYSFSQNQVAYAATDPAYQTNYFNQTSQQIAGVAPLSASTQAASAITKTSAVVSGIVDGSNLYYRFEYGISPQLGWNTTFTSTVPGRVSATLDNLQPGTTYYFRVVANNGSRMEQGQILSFTTRKADGSVVSGTSGSGTLASGSTGGMLDGVYGSAFNTSGGDVFSKTAEVTDVTKTSVIMKGEVNPNGSYTTYFFQYGTNLSLGATSLPATISGTNSFLIVAQEINNLAPATAYYYRIVAQNAYGTSYGEILKFKTSGSAPTTSGSTASQTKTTSGPYASDPNSGNTSLWASISRTFGFSRTQNCIALDGKLNPNSPAAGEEAAYTVTYKNVCDLNLMRTTLEINAPSNVVLKDSSVQFAAANGNLVAYRLDIPARSQGTITIRVSVAEGVKRGEAMPFRVALQYVDGKKMTQTVTTETLAKAGGSWFSWGSTKNSNSANMGAAAGLSATAIVINTLLLLIFVSLVVFVVLRNRASSAPIVTRLRVE